MRLGIRSPNEFIQKLNIKNELIQKKFLEKIQNITIPITTQVMLGDATVTEQKTFDPQKVKNYYEEFLQNLKLKKEIILSQDTYLSNTMYCYTINQIKRL